MIIPTGVDYQARRYPVVTFTLMGLNIAVYLLSLYFWYSDQSLNVTTIEEFKEVSLTYWWHQNFWLIPKNSSWYTYITSLFVHAGFFHMAGNMIYLFLFGSCVEDIIGRWQYILFYFIGGLAADFTHIAFTPAHFSSAVALGGASGAISACMGAFLILLPKREIEFKYFIWVKAGDFQVAAWVVMSFYFLKDLFWAFMSYADGERGGTAFGAHVGGFATGMAFALLYKAFERYQETKETRQAAIYVPIESSTVYVSENGTQLGPFTRSQVLQMLALGSISHEAVYWQDGMTDWQPILDL